MQNINYYTLQMLPHIYVLLNHLHYNLRHAHLFFHMGPITVILHLIWFMHLITSYCVCVLFVTRVLVLPELFPPADLLVRSAPSSPAAPQGQRGRVKDTPEILSVTDFRVLLRQRDLGRSPAPSNLRDADLSLSCTFKSHYWMNGGGNTGDSLSWCWVWC